MSEINNNNNDGVKMKTKIQLRDELLARVRVESAKIDEALKMKREYLYLPQELDRIYQKNRYYAAKRQLANDLDVELGKMESI